jgi:integrase
MKKDTQIKGVRGQGGVYKRGNKWWVVYYARGTRYRECGGDTKAQALKYLKQRLGQINDKSFLGPKSENIMVNELLDGLITHLKLKEAKSIPAFVSGLKPVREFFESCTALEVTSDSIKDYILERQGLGKANATINRGVTGLRQAFHLARKEGKLNHIPHFTVLKEDNARQGFFEKNEFQAVWNELPDYLKPIAQFAYKTGWRKAEIVSLKWNQVDRETWEIRLQTSKNNKGRVLQIRGELFDLIREQWRTRQSLCEFVFHNEGRRILRFDKAWKTACEKAGFPGKLFHDFRRTASRNMIRAGVGQSVAKEITGHITDHMFQRYNITSEDDKGNALLQVDKYLSSSKVKRERKVIQIR